jgi:prepilin-type N-terminal cleavage/methylation domain-containing protein
MAHKANRVAGLSGHGFTLAEVLVATAIMGVVVGAIYGVFASSDRSYRTQDRVVDAQQSVRVGIHFMAEDIRMAGFDPGLKARGPAIDSHPLDSDGAGIKEATHSKIRFTADIDMNGIIDDPKKQERITYEYDSANKRLRRCIYEGTGSQSWQPLIDNVSALSFTYLDANGNDLGDPADLSKIRTVEISMTVQEKDARQHPITRTLTTRVNCRNLGL